MFNGLRKLLRKRKKLEKYDINDRGMGRGIHVSLNLDHPEVKASIMYRLNSLAQYDIVNGKLVKKPDALPPSEFELDGHIYYHKEMIKKYEQGYDVDVDHHRSMLKFYQGEDKEE